MKIAIRFKNDKPVANWLQATNGLRKEVKKESLDGVLFTAVIKKISEPKTYSQNRFFHSDACLGKIIAGYRDAGHDLPLDKARAKDWVKLRIKTHPDIMHVEPFTNDVGEVFLVPKGFGNNDISKERFSFIISWCIRFYSEFLGITIETEKQVKERMKRERNIAKMNKKTLINCDEFAGSCC